MVRGIFGFFVIALWGIGVPRGVAQDNFPAPYNSPSEAGQNPMPANIAAGAMQVPEGFSVNVFASEPEVQNPIAIAWDKRGRMWVAENFTYAERKQRFDLNLRDRVLILEDTNHDGRADKRTVFTDQVQMLTSVEVGHGGVWLMCPPQLLFVPDADENGTPDGPPTVVLDGFTVAESNYHNFANGLRWGPDGWLYGRCGHSCPGKVGLPGTEDASRIPLHGGIWRFHPTRRTFEVLCHGTVNPWGHDWDANGELFFINTVIGHLWHMIPGAHFKESFGESLNRDVYQRMDMIADHYHFDNRLSWTNSRDGNANDFGGGHAHVGMMIYQGDELPKQYQGRLFTLNMHGRRVNVERLERLGAGYVGRHEKDWLVVTDPFFRGIEISQGPDGAVYIVDWSDTGECHEHTGVHRTSGRIYRVGYRQDTPENEPRKADTSVVRKPWCLSRPGRLAKLWSDYQANQLSEDLLHDFLEEDDEHLRVWAIRLLTDFWPLDTIIGPQDNAQYPEDLRTYTALLRMAQEDASGLVLLTLASTLQRLPLELRPPLASRLVTRASFADDPQLPLMVWYGLIPVAESRTEDLIGIASDCRWPRLSAWITRSIALRTEANSELWDRIFEITASQSKLHRTAVLTELSEATRGWQRLQAPTAWPVIRNLAAADGDLHSNVLRDLDEVFGQGRSIDQLHSIAVDRDALLPERRSAVEALTRINSQKSEHIFRAVLRERGLGFVAAQGLAQIGGSKNTQLILENLQRLSPTEKAGVIESLVARPESAAFLLDALDHSDPVLLRREDIGPFHARQILSHEDPHLTDLLKKNWGSVKPATSQQDDLKKLLHRELTPARIASANLSRGQQLFRENCSQCHRLFGEGAPIGPDLSGAQRNSLDYLLENLVSPSAVVPAEYRMTVIVTEDGRTLNGLVVKDDGKVIELQTLVNRLRIPREEIETQRLTELSSMPEGILDSLSENDRRDLIGYLMQTYPR